jgi:hypothetical protein
MPRCRMMFPLKNDKGSVSLDSEVTAFFLYSPTDVPLFNVLRTRAFEFSIVDIELSRHCITTLCEKLRNFNGSDTERIQHQWTIYCKCR